MTGGRAWVVWAIVIAAVVVGCAVLFSFSGSSPEAGQEAKTPETPAGAEAKPAENKDVQTPELVPLEGPATGEKAPKPAKAEGTGATEKPKTDVKKPSPKRPTHRPAPKGNKKRGGDSVFDSVFK